MQPDRESRNSHAVGTFTPAPWYQSCADLMLNFINGQWNYIYFFYQSDLLSSEYVAPAN